MAVQDFPRLGEDRAAAFDSQYRLRQLRVELTNRVANTRLAFVQRFSSASKRAFINDTTKCLPLLERYLRDQRVSPRK
jgi:hypothetical protein